MTGPYAGSPLIYSKRFWFAASVSMAVFIWISGGFVAWPVVAQSAPGSGGLTPTSRNPVLLVVNHRYDRKDDGKDVGLSNLEAAQRDGQRFAALLGRKSGFPNLITTVENLTKPEFDKNWAAFLDSIIEMKADGVAVFYYSGHGIEIDSDSYLVPVEARNDANEAHLRGISSSLKKMFSEFREKQAVLAARVQPVRVHGIFIIDACRDTVSRRPEPLETKNAKGFTPVTAAPVAPPTKSGMIVLYAASSGQVAHTVVNDTDGPGDGTSVYTKHLSRLLESGNAVQTSAQRVRWLVHNDVSRNPNRQPQTPAYYDELLDEIDIWGGKPDAKVGQSDAVTIRRPVDRGEPVWECETCPHLVVLPPGSFKMGSPLKEPGHHPSEEQVGTADKIDRRIGVVIPQAIAIGTREVTRGEFQSFVRSKYAGACPSSLPVCGSRESLNRPVTGVSWHEVQDYIAWLNSYLKLSPDKPDKGYYRLPTEAEWEYAARGGVDSRFISGDDPSKLCLYGNGADQSLNTMTLLSVNNTCNDGKGRDLADVQSYKPNGFGLYDVHGNAWEWVADCWTDKLGTEKAKADASGPGPGETKETCRRVARGGSWRSAPEALRLAKRVPFPPDHARVTLGFRVARVLAKSEVVAAK